EPSRIVVAQQGSARGMVDGIRLSAVERRDDRVGPGRGSQAEDQVVPLGPPCDGPLGRTAQDVEDTPAGLLDPLDLRARSLAPLQESVHDGPNLSLGPPTDHHAETPGWTDAARAVDSHRETRAQQGDSQRDQLSSADQ